MAKQSRLAGRTSNVVEVFVQDSTSTTGGGLTGLVYNAAGLTAYYKRNSASGSTAITLATITTLGTFNSGGLKEVDATNMPGLYEFHPPDAALASGADSVVFELKGATNMVPLLLEIELTAVNNQSAASFVTGVNGLAPPTNWNLTSVDGSGRVTALLAVDLYHADIAFTRDQSNTQDEYTVTWFKNGVRQTSGITSPTIQVVKRADGSDLVASASMTQVGSTGTYKYDATGAERVTLGEAVLAVASASIDSSTRTFSRLISRDSS